MNRFLALPSLAATIRGLLCCIGGVLGCTAMAGAISIGAAASADTVAHPEPEPRRSIPPVCRHAMSSSDRRTMHECRQAWIAMHERSHRRAGRDGEFHRRGDRHDGPHRTRRRSSSPRWLDELLRRWTTTPPAPRTTTPPRPRPKAGTPSLAPPKAGTPSAAPPKPTRTRSPEPPTEPARAPAPEPTPTLSQADDLDTPPPSLQPVLLLGLLLPVVAVLCYPFRHRLYAAAGRAQYTIPETTEPVQAHFGYRPTLDPFAAPVLALTGSGAAPAARILAVAALDEHGETSLVVIPRPDTTALFGLAEDELLDDDTAALFIPGNLDAALAYLETELAIRENTGVQQARRLLLVANPEGESDRIKALLDRHPGGVSVILLGAWTGDRVTVDDDGMVDAPAALHLPQRLPALSRTEARDRLFSIVAHQKTLQRPPSKRRSSPRRSQNKPGNPLKN